MSDIFATSDWKLLADVGSLNTGPLPGRHGYLSRTKSEGGVELRAFKTVGKSSMLPCQSLIYPLT